MTSRLHERYTAEVIPALQKQFEYSNPNEVPRLTKRFYPGWTALLHVPEEHDSSDGGSAVNRRRLIL